MLGLKLMTDPRWAKLAESNIEEILSDHAWCEQKAASNAISIITQNPHNPTMVAELILIAEEELSHFRMVHEIIRKRGYTFSREKKDHYVNQLFTFATKGGSRATALVDRLLFSAMIEARSCERFKVLHQTIKDEELKKFYYDLMVSEAGHYKTFLSFARSNADGIDVDKRWKEWIEFETSIIMNYGNSAEMHG